MKEKSKIFKLLFLTVICFFMFSIYNLHNTSLDESSASIKEQYAIPNDEEKLISVSEYLTQKIEENQVIYLSDIAYSKANVGWGNINLDKTSDNSAITLTVNNASTAFTKGIWAHATSTIEYDLRNYKDYAYFITYYGVNTSSGNKGNGVKFYIYTSVDGENWDLRTEEEPVAMKSADNAKYVKIDIKDANYLRLYAFDNESNAQDHSVWADAKIVKELYNDNVTMSVEEYDEIIKEKYNGGKVSKDIELLLLQRDLVNHIGQYQLRQFVEASEQNKEMFDWFFNDVDTLRLWTVGGRPYGSYVNALNVLSRLYNTYKEDLQNNQTTALGTVYSDLYLRMMLSLSLTHSASVGFWAGGGQYSDAVTRYQIYKDLHAENKLYSNRLFENLTVEEMRWVMNNIIDDEQIKWLNDYVRKTKAKNPNKNAMDGYTYINYTFDYSYGKDIYYSQENYDKWNQKYSLSDYNITYQKGKPKLWIVFEEGSVCGGLSKTTSNIWGSYGVPSSVAGQPGHAANIYYELDSAGRGMWHLNHNVQPTGWANSGKAERLRGRMPNGWGDSGASYTDTLKPDSYIFLAQEAQNEYDKYEQAELVMLLENVYKDDQRKLEEIYEDALKEEVINLDAWIGLANVYIKDENKTEEDCMELAARIQEALKFHPLPMYDLLRKLSPKITSAPAKANLIMDREATLKEATKVTSAQSAQYKEVPVVANAILGQIDSDIAKFSFDGEKAGKLVLSTALQSTGVRWDYSLDGGNEWTQTSDAEHQLTAEEIAKINVTNDIKIHMVGVDYSDKNIFTIDITQATIPSNVTMNDLENFITNTTDKMEWTLDLNGEWQSFVDNTFFDGEETVYVRVRANGTELTSEYKTFKFTISQDEKYKYIQNKYLTVKEVFKHGGGNKDNIIDGKTNTYWYSYWNQWGQYTPQAYVILELDEERYISEVDYTPASVKGQLQNSGIGTALKIYVSEDGVNWGEPVKTVSGLGVNTATKKIQFDAKKGKYVKVLCTDVQSGLERFFAVSKLELYEDTTQLEYPTADVRYSTKEATNKDVEVKLINASRHITVTNNDGKDTYTFTKNGDFTFEFVDDNGNVGSATAVVDWIDKNPPVGTVTYSTTEPTNDEVVASLTFDKEVTILSKDVQIVNNADGTRTITFDENGSFELEFVDVLGNVGKLLVEVTWIDTEAPTAEVEFNTIDLTDKPVTATLKPSEEVTILNNGGKDTYTFDRNGEFTFEFVDMAGNKGSKTVNVFWINKVPEMSVSYDITELTTQNVKATFTIEEGYRIINNGGNNVYTFEDSGTFDFEYMDEYGNIGRYTAVVDWIDKKPPVAKVSYSPEGVTEKEVIVTITLDEEVQAVEGWTLSKDKMSMTKTYANNTSETISIMDKLGNTASVPVNVTNIDKIPFEINVEYSSKEQDIKSVSVTINSNKELKEVEGWTLSEDKMSMTKTYEENVEEIVTVVEEKYGRKLNANIKIENIYDKEFNAKVSYSKTEPTNEDVIVTVTSNRKLQEIEGWKLSEDKKSMSKTYSKNANESIIVSDIEGNEKTLEISIENIDKEKPELKVEYSTSDKTDEDVVVTIKSNKELQAIEGWTLSEDKMSMTKAYNKNITEQISVKDIAGNEQIIDISIKNIDNEKLETEVEYSTSDKTNEDVVVTIKSNKELQEVEGWTLSEDKKSMTKTYSKNTTETILVKDIEGNEKEVEIAINNIDKEKPELKVEYGTSDKTNEDVVVTIKSNKELQEVEGWTLSEDKKSMTKTYSKNTTETIIVKDIEGNEIEVNIKVDNIIENNEITEDNNDNTENDMSNDTPNTGDINVILYISVFIVCLFILRKRVINNKLYK